MQLQNISNKTLRYVEMAQSAAQASSYPIFRHGAVLVKSGRIINVSCNKANYSYFADRFAQHSGHATEHAEVGVILGQPFKLTRNSTVYVVRINPQSQLRLSKPCAMCMQVLSFVGVKKVIYSIEDDLFGCEKL